jgi:phosphopentomutase
MRSVILIFVDGVGIGQRVAANPFHESVPRDLLTHFDDELGNDLPYDGVVLRTDPRLGIEGRPQSASGQTTILTGVNAPQVLGYHKQGFPNETLRKVIATHSIFRQLKEFGIGPNIFANTYTPQFFTATPRWKSATTVAVEAAGMSFMRLPDLLGEKSLFHDFTNRLLIERGYNLPEFSPSRAGQILASLAERHRFVLYEHFLTDKIGHDRDLEAAKTHLPQLAAFVKSCLEAVDLEDVTIMLTSDHGNIEDLSVRNHTLNDVPTLIWGRGLDFAASTIRDLADITPTIIKLLTE